MGRVGWRLEMRQKKQQTGKADKVKSPAEMKANQTYDETQFSLKHQTDSLRQVKQLLDAYPMDLDEDKQIDIETVLSFKNYIEKLPILIKLIDFTNSEHVRICYETLEKSGQADQMTPEEALALLDGQFGDINVRIFAVKKLSLLEDSHL